MSQDLVKYVLKRLLTFPVYLLIFSATVFFIAMYAPGDPVQILAGKGASAEVMENIRHQYGLDKPPLIQYRDYMVRFVQFDWGESLRFRGKEVIELVLERVPISAPLGFISLVLTLTIGTTVGLTAAFRKGTRLDTILISSWLLFAAIPSLLIVQLFVFVLAIQLHWLPAGWTGGWTSAFTLTAVIPILSMSLPGVVGFARFVRTITLGIVDQPYVMAAKAKGVPPHRRATRYVLRNAMLPLTTVVVPALFSIIEGSFFIEKIYDIPGFAVFIVDSVFGRDYPVILSVGIFGSMLSIFVILLVDILYRFADPRVNIAK